MKKTVREYPSGCTWCNATGTIYRTPASMTVPVTDACSVCNGSGVIIITETITDDFQEQTVKKIISI